MVLNKQHPDYPEFERKLRTIQNQFDEEISQCSTPEGQDGPDAEIYRRSSQRLKALQKEYHYLYKES